MATRTPAAWDIEFIVQFLVLAHAAAYPQLTANSGNLALLALAGRLGLVDAQRAEQVCAVAAPDAPEQFSAVPHRRQPDRY
jgi:glutamine synthetase adenylyltransferase